MLLESFWIVFGSDDAALRAAAEPHISLTHDHYFDFCCKLLFAILTTQVTSQSPLFFLFRRAAPISCRDATQKGKPPYYNAMDFGRPANFMYTIEAKTMRFAATETRTRSPSRLRMKRGKLGFYP